MDIEDIGAQIEAEEKRVNDEKLEEERIRIEIEEEEKKLRKFIHSFFNLLKMNYKWEVSDGTNFLYITKSRVNTVDVSVKFLIECKYSIPSKIFQEQDLINDLMLEYPIDSSVLLLKQMLMGPNAKLRLVG